MSALSEFQDGFGKALAVASGEAPAGLPPVVEQVARQAGFSVYRNTVMKGWIETLETNFPAVVQLVGEEWFRAAAAAYARAHPPRSPLLVLYGRGFGRFLSGFRPARELPYLPGVAMLDWLCVEAATAADAPEFDPAALAALPPDLFGACSVTLHPASRFVWIETTVPSIWLDARGFEPEKDELSFEQRGEGLLITRRAQAVSADRLSIGGHRFIELLARGRSLSDAATAALQCEPELDLSVLMARLLERAAFTTLHRPR